MKNIWRTLSLTVSLIGVVLFPHTQTQAIGSQVQDKTPYYNDTEPALSFVAKYVDSRVDSNGKVTVTGSRVRYVKANGEWQEVMRRQSNSDAPSQQSERITIYAGTPDGVYEKRSDPPSRRYVSEPANQQMLDSFRSPYYLRNNQDFVRTEQVAGLVVYVQRTEIKDPAYQGYWIETSYSPKTGLNPLRTIMHFGDGSEIRTEALSVEFTEVLESLNDDLKSPPVKQEEKLKQN
jgi:hypothetical protein